MKILVLAPVLNAQLSGGVAAVSENLVNGFRLLGHDANIVSLAKSSNINNIVVGHKKYNDINVVLSLDKVAKILKKEQPDLVVSTLQYNLGIKLYRKACPKSKFISVIHGAANPSNGKLHALFVNLVAKYSCKNFDKNITVSFLSQAINKWYYKISCEAVIPNGICIPESANFNKPYSKRPFDFLYLGRLTNSKNVELLARSFLKAKEKKDDITLAIAGTGPLSCLFEKQGKYDLPGITYLGKVPHENVFEVYSNAKVFLSLYELETLATTYMEAAICGCTLASPYSSGQNQLFVGDAGFHCIDTSSDLILSNELLRVLSSCCELPQKSIDEYKAKFSNKLMAQRYLDLISNN